MSKEKKTTPRSVRIISILYAVLGVIDLAILLTSGFEILYIGVLGGLTLLAAVGLWMLKRWGLWVALPITPLNAVMGIVTLYSSVGFGGINPNIYTMTLHMGLVCYVIAIVVLFYYLTTRRRFFG